MPDYIPRSDARLETWSANFAKQVADNAATWNITNDEVIDLQIATDNFAELMSKNNSPAKSAIIVAEKDAARKALISRIRRLANFQLKNPVITVAQRIAMGLRTRSSRYSTVPPPVSRPEFSIDVRDVRCLEIHFRDMGSANKAKPYGINGAVIVYSVLDAAPASYDELTRRVLATRTPYILEFTEPERGKTVYLAICWQNGKGKTGPFSGIKSAIVP
jgi:hypothetical protein